MSNDRDRIDDVEFGDELDRAVNKVLQISLPEVAEKRVSPDQWCVDRLFFECIPHKVSAEFLDKSLGIKVTTPKATETIYELECKCIA